MAGGRPSISTHQSLSRQSSSSNLRELIDQAMNRKTTAPTPSQAYQFKKISPLPAEVRGYSRFPFGRDQFETLHYAFDSRPQEGLTVEQEVENHLKLRMKQYIP